MLTENEFLQDIVDHKLNVILNNNLHRHLRFQTPGSMLEHFDIITWPNYLCFTGDMGTFVFSRRDDMFTYFRGHGNNGQPLGLDAPLIVKPDHWFDKLEAIDKCGGAKKWSPELFTKNLYDQYHYWAAGLDDSDIKAGWSSVQEDIVDLLSDGGEEHAYQLVANFSIDGKKPFEDFFEVSSSEFTHHYLWACYAIAWGIRQHDLSLVTSE